MTLCMIYSVLQKMNVSTSEIAQNPYQDHRKRSGSSLGWPTEIQSTLAGLPTNSCIKHIYQQ